MKKQIAILCMLGVVLSSAGCTFAAEESKKDIVSVENSQQEGTKEVLDSNNEQTQSETEPETTSSALPTIDEQVLWEVDGVKITATGIEEDMFWGSKVNVLVENNSDKDVQISLDALIVNDYMISDLTSFEVTAGNKSNDSITLLSSELQAAGIDNIGKIELYMRMYDPETYETLNESGCITISTSDASNIDTESSINGVTLFDQNGIKIVGQYVDEDSFWGASALLYVENNSGKNITLYGDDVAINGFMITSACYEKIYAGKKAITNVTFFSSDLEDNNITSIDEIEMTFKATDDNFNEVANSGKVKFSAK